MMPADWSLSLLLGLASTPHCAAMCGPLVMAYGAHCPRGAAAPHLAYQAGRILTYSLLGALAGWFGQGAFLLGHLAGLERAVALVAGILLVVTGLALTGIAGRSNLVQLRTSSSRGWVRHVTPLLLSASAASKLGLGLGMGLLPCGMVWAALAKSAASGTPWDGAAGMAAFGCGTAVSLLAIGFFAGEWQRRVAPMGTRLAAVGLILFGLVTIWRGARPQEGGGNACHVHHRASS